MSILIQHAPEIHKILLSIVLHNKKGAENDLNDHQIGVATAVII